MSICDQENPDSAGTTITKNIYKKGYLQNLTYNIVDVPVKPL